MTEKELNLIEILANVWNEYLQLPEQHCNDRQEFCEAIHRLQHLLMIRDARRNHPDVFPYQIETTIEIDNMENIEEELSSKLKEKIEKTLNF